jgi:hypothetical protein
MSNAIRSIIEDKVSQYFIDAFTGNDNVAIHKGITDETRVIPLIIVYADSARPDPSLGANPLGNFRVALKVFVYTSADDETLAVHRARVDAVQALMADVPALQAYWEPEDGQLYAAWIVGDDEAMSQRRYGNVIEFNLVVVLPPEI